MESSITAGTSDSDGDFDALDELDSGAATPEAKSLPAVVAAIVSTGGAALEETVRSLTAQRYGGLTVLVLDVAPSPPLAGRVAAVAPQVLVRRLEDDCTFHEAANDLIESVQGAQFLLICRDNVIFEDSAVGTLVEEAFRSNAAILGPKVVADEAPDALLDVGYSIDHYGEPFSAIDVGELDQEQHDAVRDVFYVGDTALLVRSDLFQILGGFDADCGPAAALDLAWRARVAGARVVVAPDARVRRIGGGRVSDPDGRTDPRAAVSGRLRAVCKSYSTIALVWVIPVALLLSSLEAFGRVLLGRFGSAGAIFGGWADTTRNLSSLRARRHDAQALRTVDDHEVRMFMVRGSARARTFATRRLHADERLASASYRTRNAIDEASGRLRQTETLLVFGIVFVLLIGLRSFVTGGVASVGGFSEWLGVRELLGASFATHRVAMLGGASPAPPVLAMFGLVSSVGFGDVALMRTLLVVAAAPVGVYGMFRFMRGIAASAWPAVGASVAYAANPILRNAYEKSELAALATFAIAPFLYGVLFGRLEENPRSRWPRRMRLLAATLLTALCAMVWPTGIAIPVVFAIANLFATPFVATPFVEGMRAALRELADAALVMLGAMVLLLPWSTAYLVRDGSAVGWVERSPVGVARLVAFRTGASGSGWAAFGIVAAALLSLIVASGARWQWAGRAWLLAVVGFVLAYLPQRIDVHAAIPSLEGTLVIAAFGLAMAVGVGIAAFLAEIRTFLFGFRQAAAIVTALALAAMVLGLLADLPDGRFHAPREAWSSSLSWLPTEAHRLGAFRVVWLGDNAALPVDGIVRDDLAFTVTANGTGDARYMLPRASGDVSSLGDAIRLARDGRTVRLGHLLEPMGVKYLAVAERAAPSSSAHPVDPSIESALAAQLDLSAVESHPGLRLYRNEAWRARDSPTARSASNSWIRRGMIVLQALLWVAALAALALMFWRERRARGVAMRPTRGDHG